MRRGQRPKNGEQSEKGETVRKRKETGGLIGKSGLRAGALWIRAPACCLVACYWPNFPPDQFEAVGAPASGFSDQPGEPPVIWLSVAVSNNVPVVASM